MNIQEMQELLDKTEDKFSVFADRDKLKNSEFSVNELVDVIYKYLSEDEIVNLFSLPHFKTLKPNIKYAIIKNLSDQNKYNLLFNSDFMEGMKTYNIENIIESLEKQSRIKLLQNPEFFKKYDFKYMQVEIIMELDDTEKSEILLNKDLINQLEFKEYELTKMVGSISDDKLKEHIIDNYDFKLSDITDILITFSDEKKNEYILGSKYEFSKFQIIELISSLSMESFVTFLNDNKEFLHNKNIEPYSIIRDLPYEKQLEFVSKIEQCNLSLEEKRLILVVLNEETKSNINTENFPPEYLTALQIKTVSEFSDIINYGNIIIDYNSDLTQYKGLDPLISVFPQHLSAEEMVKFHKLCEICPNLKVRDELDVGVSTVEDYQRGEEWVNKILAELKEDWTDIQKLAYIDLAIGTKISYSPNFDTETFDMNGSRALWKIISSGYGVCNGISQVEQYILSKVGIQSKLIGSESHSFLLVKGIDIPMEGGTLLKRNTIVDPTWNLAANRYRFKPANFCKSYNEIRKHDIREDGTDAKCHETDELDGITTTNLEDDSLRRVYRSIGLTQEDGNFPIITLVEDRDKIYAKKQAPEKTIQELLEAVSNYQPNFAECNNSTMTILSGVMLNQENINFEKCVVNRVYERQDDSKNPILYVYLDIPERGKIFYYADKTDRGFNELTQKQFEEKFECFDTDLQKNDGVRPWDDKSNEKSIQDLSTSSGEIEAKDKAEEGGR